MAEYIEADVVCPFFIKCVKARTLYCESPIDKAKISMHFNAVRDTEQHMRRYCLDMQAYHDCPIAQNLNKKYGVKK